jgi:hypothetical protein
VIDEKADTPLAALLIHELLRSEPTRLVPQSCISLTIGDRFPLSSRIGYEETIAILEHPFFHEVDTTSIINQTASPPFIPPDPSEGLSEIPHRAINSSLTSDEMVKLLKYKPYQGKASIWKEFGPMYR